MDLIVRARGAPAMEKLALHNRKSPVDYRVLGWQKTGGGGGCVDRPGPFSIESRRWPWRGALRTTNGAREPEHRGDPGRDRTGKRPIPAGLSGKFSCACTQTDRSALERTSAQTDISGEVVTTQSRRN